MKELDEFLVYKTVVQKAMFIVYELPPRLFKAQLNLGITTENAL